MSQHEAETEQLEALVELLRVARERGEDIDPYQVVYEHPNIADRLEKRLDEVGLFDVPPRPPTDPHDLPAQFGRYLVHARLGEGSAGIVYEATDRLLRREVAIKVFHGCAGTQAGERFERDARVAASLQHRHIVTVHDVGRCGSCTYFVMSLAAGGTLASLLERERQGKGGIPPRPAVELVRKVALALDYAHRSGVVHRDVKPANILLDESGEPLLADFGLARRAGADCTLTVPGEILGTFAYLSPEQAAGHSHEAGPRSDIYALGVVLYELLTGQRPFDTGSVPALLALVAEAPPPRPRAVDPSVPRELELICLKALAKHPDDRFSSAEEMAEQLRRWLAHEPVTIAPVPYPTRLARWVERRPRQAASLAGGVLLTITIGLLVGWIVLHARSRAEAEEQKARQAEAREAAEAQARAVVETHSLLDQARRRLRLPIQGRRIEAQQFIRAARRRRQDVEGVEGLQLDLELRSAFVHTLGEPDMQRRHQAEVRDHFVLVRRVALHPDGNRLAVGMADGPRLWRAGSPFAGAHGAQPDDPRPWLTFTPDGSFLLLAAPDGGLELWDAEASSRLASWGKGSGKVLAVGFVQGSHRVRTCRNDGTIHVLSLPALMAGLAKKLSPNASHVTVAAFAPNGDLAVADATGTVRLFDAAGNARRGGPPKSRSTVTALAWSNDGNLLAVGSEDGAVLLWDMVDDAPRHRQSLFASEVVNLVFHPHWPWLAAGDRGQMRIWDLTTGALILRGVGVPWGFSRDGRVLATSTVGGIAFQDLLLPQGLVRLHGHRASVHRIVWARSAPRLASLDQAFEVHVWEVGRSSALARLAGPVGSYAITNAAIALSDDGRRLAFASGGDPAAAAMLDLEPVLDQGTQAQAARKEAIRHGPWPMPAGFDRLACQGGDRFLLVREERQQRSKDRDMPNACPMQTVAYELDESGPRHRRVLRSAEPCDVRRFLDSGLTADGRLYWWSGPRLPESARRVEVREIVTGKLIWQMSAPAAGGEASLPTCRISPDGKHLWVQRPNDNERRYELPDDYSGKPDVPPFAYLSGRWYLRCPRMPASHETFLHAGIDAEAWLRLENEDGSTLRIPAFSPDGRFLAWADDSGTLSIAELDALKEAVMKFEQEPSEGE